MAIKRIVSRERALRGHLRKLNDAIVDRLADGAAATGEQKAEKARLQSALTAAKAARVKANGKA